jgi:hypothetical protein
LAVLAEDSKSYAKIPNQMALKETFSNISNWLSRKPSQQEATEVEDLSPEEARQRIVEGVKDARPLRQQVFEDQITSAYVNAFMTESHTDDEIITYCFSDDIVAMKTREQARTKHERRHYDKEWADFSKITAPFKRICMDSNPNKYEGLLAYAHGLNGISQEINGESHQPSTPRQEGISGGEIKAVFMRTPSGKQFFIGRRAH